jgi:hypothetical protein
MYPEGGFADGTTTAPTVSGLPLVGTNHVCGFETVPPVRVQVTV